jgi:hypothetical protein
MINFYETIPKHFLDDTGSNPNFELHRMKIPFRACVVASSGGGKTNFITNLIHLFCKGKSGTFHDITVICKDKTEPLYKYLASKSDSLQVKEGQESLPDLDKIDKEQTHLIILDDLQMDKHQERLAQFYIRGRKKNVSILYLAQNYYYIPLVIRGNCNYLILLKLGNNREISSILKTNGLAIDKEQLLKMYKYATSEQFTPLIVDIESGDDLKKYRRGLTEYLNSEDFK